MIAVWIWTVACIVGVGVTIWMLRDSLRDRQALEIAQVVNGRKVIAQGAVRNNIVRLVVLSLFALLGVMVLLRPYVAAFEDYPWLVRDGLVTGVVLLVWDAWQDRKMIRSMWPRERGRPVPYNERDDMHANHRDP